MTAENWTFCDYKIVSLGREAIWNDSFFYYPDLIPHLQGQALPCVLSGLYNGGHAECSVGAFAEFYHKYVTDVWKGLMYHGKYYVIFGLLP